MGTLQPRYSHRATDGEARGPETAGDDSEGNVRSFDGIRRDPDLRAIVTAHGSCARRPSHGPRRGLFAAFLPEERADLTLARKLRPVHSLTSKSRSSGRLGA